MARVLRGLALAYETLVGLIVMVGASLAHIMPSTRASTAPRSSGSCWGAPPFLSGIPGDVEWGAEEAAAQASDWELVDEDMRKTSGGGGS